MGSLTSIEDILTIKKLITLKALHGKIALIFQALAKQSRIQKNILIVDSPPMALNNAN